MSHSNALGLLGEKYACLFLKKNGYIILETNYYERCGEIDIIAKIYDDNLQNDVIVFVEVKTRTYGGMVSGREAVGYRKKKKIMLTVNSYMRRKYGGNLNNKTPWIRIDVIEIIFNKDGKATSIDHLKNSVTL